MNKLICFVLTNIMIACSVDGDDSKPFKTQSNLINTDYDIERAITFIDSAVLYVYYPEHYENEMRRLEDMYIITGDGEFHRTIIPEYTRTLSQSEVVKMNEFLIRKEWFATQSNDCFNPHHGIVFWDSNGNQMGNVSICLNCQDTRQDPDELLFIPLWYYAKIINTYKLPINHEIIGNKYKKLHPVDV